MENHYSPPRALITEADTQLERWGLLFWLVAIGSSLLSFLAGLFGSFAIPAFAELFAGFGAELPTPTLITLRLNHWLWLPSLAALLVWTKWFGAVRDSYSRKRFFSLFTGIGLAVMGIMAFTIWAIYLPVFKMGEAVVQ